MSFARWFFCVGLAQFGCSTSPTQTDARAADAGDGGSLDASVDGRTDAAMTDITVVDSTVSEAAVIADSAAGDAADAGVRVWPALPMCINEIFGTPMVLPHNVSMQSNPDNTVTATLWRCWAEQGVGESAIYRADRFEIRFGGLTLRAVTSEIFDYTNTHHNWADSARIEVDGYTVFWRAEYIISDSGYLAFFVRVNRGQSEILRETELRER